MGGLHAACRRHEVLAVYLFGSAQATALIDWRPLPRKA